MAEEQPSLHIDTDWKKQAQEEKKRLAEKAQQEQVAKPQVAAATPVPGAAPAATAPTRGRRGQRELPPASIATLAQSLMTQAVYYLTDLAYQGGDPVANLDMAKHNIDTLTILEEKTANNLTDDERHALDLALHNARARYINVASQFI
jgi:hypothetical protein